MVGENKKGVQARNQRENKEPVTDEIGICCFGHLGWFRKKVRTCGRGFPLFCVQGGEGNTDH